MSTEKRIGLIEPVGESRRDVIEEDARRADETRQERKREREKKKRELESEFCTLFLHFIIRQNLSNFPKTFSDDIKTFFYFRLYNLLEYKVYKLS